MFLSVESVERAVRWLIRSKRDGEGSAAYYSRIFEPLNGWSNSYPETTGYIIPTLLCFGKQTKKEIAINIALEMAEWLLSIQDASGGFLGGLYGAKKTNLSVFNTAQIIFGLIASYEYTSEEKYLSSALKAAKWLTTVQEPNGEWKKFSYKQGYFPSYYTRVAWPMLVVALKTHDRQIYERAIAALNIILKRQTAKYAIRDWGFEPKTPAFTHTIAYTIRGFLESAFLLEHNGKDFFHVASKASYKLFRLFEINGKLAGSYSDEWIPNYRFSCLTGHCQIAICWMRIYQKNGDVRLLNAASKLIEYVEKHQVIKPGHVNDGAIPGSVPLWGPYMRFRYPNWTVKFFVDAKLLLQKLKRDLSEKCARNSTLEFSKNTTGIDCSILEVG